jgi:hypothetical protein
MLIMKKMINKSHVEGILYESTLEERDSKSTAGTKYITGKLSIEVAENNIITVDIFENEITKAGKKNQKYDKLQSLIGANSIVTTGKDTAVCLKIDSALSLNDWYPQGELVSTLRNFNGFINFISIGELKPQATFQADMLITSTIDDMDKDENGDFIPNGALKVKGYIFDFANRIMPVEFLVENEAGVNYFRDLEPNTFTKVWGKQVTQSETIRKVEESAFGDDKVVEFTNNRRKFVITGTNKEPYMFGEEGILTVQEVQDAIANRNVYLADKKAQSENDAPASTKPVVSNPSTATFTF